MKPSARTAAVRRLARATRGRVVPLSPARAARAAAGVDTTRCGKCESTFVAREPAFLHCRFCGKLTRVESGSLLDQELFELRSGLRLAS